MRLCTSARILRGSKTKAFFSKLPRADEFNSVEDQLVRGKEASSCFPPHKFGS